MNRQGETQNDGRGVHSGLRATKKEEVSVRVLNGHERRTKNRLPALLRAESSPVRSQKVATRREDKEREYETTTWEGFKMHEGRHIGETGRVWRINYRA